MIDIKNSNYKVNKKDIVIKQFKINSLGVFQIVGPNGVGKTRLLEYIYATSKDDNSIAYLSQKIFLFKNLSIKENFEMLIPNFEVGMCDELLKLLNINKDLNFKVKLLSKGQQRKIQIIIILSQKVDYIFLDEPFNHLDKDAKKDLLAVFNELGKEHVILLVDHSKSIHTINLIKHEEIIDYSYDGLYNPTNETVKFKFNYKLIKNLSFFGKFFSIVLLIVLFLSTTYVMENNTLYFSDHSKKVEPITAQCIDNRIGPATEYFFEQKNELVHIPFKNRLYFNRFYFNSSLVGEYLIRLQQPANFFTSYDTPYEEYGYSKCIKEIGLKIIQMKS